MALTWTVSTGSGKRGGGRANLYEWKDLEKSKGVASSKFLKTGTKSRIRGFVKTSNLRELGNPDNPFLFQETSLTATSEMIVRMEWAKAAKTRRQTKIEAAFLAATFFQVLVANTPMDDFYTKKKTITVKRKVKETRQDVYDRMTKNDPLYKKRFTIKDLDKKDLDRDRRVIGEKVYTYEREEEHEPDNDIIRGDWILNFQGIKIKAFPTDNAVDADYAFSVYDFLDPADETTIKKVAEKILELTKYKKGNFNWYVENINERITDLEFGGYKKDKKSQGPSRGFLYKRLHGVTDGGFVYQAPRGFIRRIEARYNQYTLAAERIASKILKSSFKDFDIASSEEQALMSGRSFEDVVRFPDGEWGEWSTIGAIITG